MDNSGKLEVLAREWKELPAEEKETFKQKAAEARTNFQKKVPTPEETGQLAMEKIRKQVKNI